MYREGRSPLPASLFGAVPNNGTAGGIAPHLWATWAVAPGSEVPVHGAEMEVQPHQCSDGH